MNHDGVLKALHRHNVAWAHVLHSRHLHNLLTGLTGIGKQIRAGSRHQGTSRKGQSQSLCHNLHGGSRSDKGAGATARTCIALCPVQFFFGDLASLEFRTVHTKLL